MSHPLAESVIRALVRGQPVSREDLAHLGQCDSCGASYARLCDAERALEGAEGLSARALAAMEETLLDASAAQGQPSARPRWAWLRVPALSLLGLAAALVLVLRVAPQSSGFAARGTGTDEPAPRVQVLCVGPAGVAADVAMVERPGTTEGLPCGQDGVLGFAVTAPTGWEARHLFLVGVGRDGQVRWYHPRPEEGASVALPEGALTSHVLPAVRLAVNHNPGITQLWALFTQHPLSVAQVAQAVAHGSLDTASLDPALVLHSQVVVP